MTAIRTLDLTAAVALCAMATLKAYSIVDGELGVRTASDALAVGVGCVELLLGLGFAFGHRSSIAAWLLALVAGAMMIHLLSVGPMESARQDCNCLGPVSASHLTRLFVCSGLLFLAGVRPMLSGRSPRSR